MEAYDSKRPGTDRAWIELDLKNLDYNVRQLRSLMADGCDLMAVVKAQAYGHGGAPVASRLEKLGVRAFAVATLGEGIALRRQGIRGDILILGYTCPSLAAQLKEFDLIQTLAGPEHAAAISVQGAAIRAHIKVDTGMHRLGFDADDAAGIMDTFRLPHIRIEGIYSHLCAADSTDEENVRFTRQQVRRFDALRDILAARGITGLKFHIQSSYGLLNHPQVRCDYVRAGIALYGVYSSPEDQPLRDPRLRPVLSLRSRVALIRQLPRGEAVGYGRTFITRQDTRIAVISIGYADGVPRSLSCGGGAVLVAGERAPIIGRVCMDQLTVDITHIPGAEVGMAVTIIGRDGASEITAPEMARAAGTITNELLSCLGPRLPIVMKDGDHWC